MGAQGRLGECFLQFLWIFIYCFIKEQNNEHTDFYPVIVAVFIYHERIDHHPGKTAYNSNSHQIVPNRHVERCCIDQKGVSCTSDIGFNTIWYSYDDLSRMTEIKRYVDGSNDEILMDNIQYDTESLLTQFDNGNDLEMTISYDSRDRISTIDVKNNTTSYLDLDYTYDSSSNITQLVNGWRDTNSNWHTQTESYNYDGLNRLTSASCTSWSHTYTYDKVGNITAKDSTTYMINSVNEVTALSDGTSFSYDSNGNRTQKTKGTDTWDYTYDYANRLTKVEENDTTVGEYVYDGGCNRLQVTESGITTTYIYSGPSILYEENSTGQATYIYGPSGMLAKRTTINEETNIFYYHSDHLGSTRLVTDDNKNIVSAVTYHPFGETYSEEGSEVYLYNGKELDETGLYYYGARYYDASLGRFLTRDPLQGRMTAPQTMNRYTYCLNNPTSCIDPSGLATYHNVDTGVSIRVCQDGSWVAYDATGAKITDSAEMADLLDSEEGEGWAEATIKILQMLGYTVTGNNIASKDTNGDGIDDTVTLDIDGENVEIKLTADEGPKRDPMGYPIFGNTNRADGVIKVTIYDMDNMTPNKLYHVLGHEMIHAEHFASGQWDEWEEIHGECGANLLSEIAAHSWNVTQHWVIPCWTIYNASEKWLDQEYRIFPKEDCVPYDVQTSVHSQYSQWRWLVNGWLPK